MASARLFVAISSVESLSRTVRYAAADLVYSAVSL
jgi:hypothetical protein